MRACDNMNEHFTDQNAAQRDGSYKNDLSNNSSSLQRKRDQLSRVHHSRSSRNSRAGSSRETNRLLRSPSQTPSNSPSKTAFLSSSPSRTPAQCDTRRSHTSYRPPLGKRNGRAHTRVTYSPSLSEFDSPLRAKREAFDCVSASPSPLHLKRRGRKGTFCSPCYIRRGKPQYGEIQVSAEYQSKTPKYSRNNQYSILIPARQSNPGAELSWLVDVGRPGSKMFQNSVSTDMATEKIGTSHKRGTHLQDKGREDFLWVWRMLGKWPIHLKKTLLLYLSEDYLWMFWQNFSKPLYRDAYFSQYEIKTSSGERVIDQIKKGNVFMNLTSLSLSSKFSFSSCPFNSAFPVLKALSVSEVYDAEPMLMMMYPTTLEVIRLKNVLYPTINSVLEINWFVNFPKLQLLENNIIDEEYSRYSGFCRSSGLPLMKPEKGAKHLFIMHLDTFTEGTGSLDISLLPKALDCEEIALVGKRLTNIGKMLKIRDKFPVLKQVTIYTNSKLDEELIHDVSQAIGNCLVADLSQLKRDT